jgi:hypothetical protein
VSTRRSIGVVSRSGGDNVGRMNRRLIALVIGLVAAFTGSVVVAWNLVDTTQSVPPVQLSP